MKQNININKEKLLVIRGYGSAVAAAILFGSVSSVSKPTLSDINPILLSSMVYLIAATTMIPIIKAKTQNIIIFIKKERLSSSDCHSIMRLGNSPNLILLWS